MKEETKVHGRVEIYKDNIPTGRYRHYKGVLKRDFEDGSYLVEEDGKEILIETYFGDTLTPQASTKLGTLPYKVLLIFGG